MKYCKNCHTPYPDDAEFCVSCGCTEFIVDQQNEQQQYGQDNNSNVHTYSGQLYGQNQYGYNDTQQNPNQIGYDQKYVSYDQNQNSSVSGNQTSGQNGQSIYIQNVIQNDAPVGQLKTNRGLLKFILLSIVTLGIYALVYFSSISTDINIIASRYDGRKTTHFCLMAFILAPITLSIYMFVWYHKLSARIGSELQRRSIDYKFGAADFWLWDILGALILVGPFIYMHKLSKAMNLLAEDYNKNG